MTYECEYKKTYFPEKYSNIKKLRNKITSIYKATQNPFSQTKCSPKPLLPFEY